MALLLAFFYLSYRVQVDEGAFTDEIVVLCLRKSRKVSPNLLNIFINMLLPRVFARADLFVWDQSGHRCQDELLFAVSWVNLRYKKLILGLGTIRFDLQ